MASYSTDVLYTTTYSSTMQYAKNMTKKKDPTQRFIFS